MDNTILKDLKALQSELQATSSTLEKQSILKEKLHNDEKLKELVLFVYNPHKKFGITSKRIEDFKKDVVKTKQYSLFDLLEELSNRSITGDKAVMAVLTYIDEYKDYKNLILDIIDKDLKVHISKKGLLNTFNDNATKKMNFSVALAQSYDGKTKQLVDKNWFISRKLDGVRCITIIRNGQVKYFSRQGKEFLTLGKITEEIKRLGLDNIVLDGEVAKVVGDTEDFQGMMKEIRKKDYTIQNLKYFVFDVLTLEEFDSGTSKRSFLKRMNERPNIESNIIVYLEQLPYSKKTFEEMEKKVQDNGWEGLMLRKNTTYKGKRSKDILKVKNFKDDEFRVESINTGPVEQYNKKKNTYEKVQGLTAVVIKYKGNEVAVGSGFSAQERLDFMKHPEKIIGKLIKVRYFEESTNQENNELSLRFPTFKGIIGDQRDT